MTSEPAEVPTQVLRFFDRLVRDRASVEDIVHATSSWLDRTVAARHQEAGDSTVVAKPDGSWERAWPEGLETLSRDGVEVGLGPASGVDSAAVLDRLCFAVALAFDDAQRHILTMPEARSVEALVRSDGAAATRRHALQRLGLSAGTSIRCLAAAGPAAGLTTLTGFLRDQGLRVAVAPQGSLTVMLTVGPRLTALLQEGVPRAVQLGVSGEYPAADAAKAWAEARAAFRFSQPSPRDRGPYLLEEGIAFEYWRLRGYEALAEGMTPALIDRMQDVQALDRVVRTHGPEMLRTLDVVVAAPSVRHAARSLDTHHNTIAHRVAVAEKDFGFSVTDLYGRSRLFVAITLRRIRETHLLVE